MRPTLPSGVKFLLRESLFVICARGGVVNGPESLGAGGVIVGECGVGVGDSQALGILVCGEGAVRVRGFSSKRVGGYGARVFSDFWGVSVVYLDVLLVGIWC